MTPVDAPSISRDTAKSRAVDWDRAFEIAISALLGLGFFLLLRATPDIPGGFDGYRHVKQASRLITEPRAMFADPWHLAYFWRVPVDAWFGYHVLLAPFTYFFDLITATKVCSSLIFALIAYTLFKLLGHLQANFRFIWVILAMTGSSITLSRATTVRPFLLSVLLTLLAALWTATDRPVKLAAVSLLHALSYSMFFLVGMAPAIWFLLRRDRRSCIAALSCGAGMVLGLLANPYFPENLRFDIVQASVVSLGQKAHVHMGGELYPATSWLWIVSCLPVALPWAGALILRLRNWRQSVPAADLFLLLSAATFLGTLRVIRTVDFFVPFAILFAAAVISPYIKASRTDVLAAGLLLALPCFAHVYLTRQYVREAPSLARYRGAAEYLRVNAPGALVANTQWNDYQLLFFLNSSNRYVIGIEPTFTYLEDPRKYWLWFHISEDEPGTCDHETCADTDRTDIVAAVRQDLGAQYVLADHDANPRLESILRGKTNVTEVYRDAAFSVYRIDS
jgi:hypothetical protein